MVTKEVEKRLQELQVELARNKDKLKENPPKTLDNANITPISLFHNSVL